MSTKFKAFTDYIEIKNFTGHEGRQGVFQTKLNSSELDYFSQAEGCFPVNNQLLDYQREEHPEITCGIYMIRIEDESAEKGKTKTESGFYDYIGLTANDRQRDFQSGIFGRLFNHYRKLVCLPSRGNFAKLIKKYHLGIDLSEERREDKEKKNENRNKAIQHLKDQKFSDLADLRKYFQSPHLSSGAKIVEYCEDLNPKFINVFQQCRKSNDLDTIEGINKFFSTKVQVSFIPVDRGNTTEQKFREKIAKGEGVALASYKARYGEFPFLNTRDEVGDFDTFPLDGDDVNE
ncbi:hypothetical protein OAD53_02880 [Gammaproteobacteria bacterium]|nr:hypothetical protein [Gammaproteobacteria bacterium]